MAFVQAVADDGTLLLDQEGKPVFIPAPKESRKSSKISPDNELSPLDKTTLEQKKHYQEYIFNYQHKNFEAVKVTRGKAAVNGSLFLCS